jgi:hypothetical protein
MSVREELVPVKPNHRFDEERLAHYLRKELDSFPLCSNWLCL